MTSGQKMAFSLLITVSLFAALVVASFLGLFSFIDKKIYMYNSIIKKIEGKSSEGIEKKIKESKKAIEKLENLKQ